MAMKATVKPKAVRKVSIETTLKVNRKVWADFARTFDEQSRAEYCSWAAGNLIKHLMYENPDLLNEWLQWQLKRQSRNSKKEAY